MGSPTPLAIIAGSGALPRLLATACKTQTRPYILVEFAGQTLDWAENHPRLRADFHQLGAMFDALLQAGCREAVFAGAMQRPHLDLQRLDTSSTRLVQALSAGDDTTLRAAADLFQSAGLTVRAAQDICPELLIGAGSLGQVVPAAVDLADITRAMEITRALGRLDLGQGAVVAQGLCLGLESLQGTDQMLAFVARSAGDLRPQADGAKGVLVKAAKPQQDRRFDLPAIGAHTIGLAARAGLAGVALSAGAGLLLDRQATLSAADRLGLFVYGVADPGQ